MGKRGIDRVAWLEWWVAAAVCLAGCTSASPVESLGHGREPSQLRVGTIGDLPPFSLATSTGYTGVDIDLAHDLGRELGLPIVFVPTTWQTLTRDAIEHRFDLAMNGINVIDERAWSVEFSRPYSRDRRVAVVRCAHVDELSTAEALNQPRRTVFVAAGTSSAAFALRRFPRAQVRQVRNIDLYFARLAQGEGDAIIDTEHRVQLGASLCLGLAGARLFPRPIAILFPRGSPLVTPVDLWLRRLLADGTVRRLFQRYGVGVRASD